MKQLIITSIVAYKDDVQNILKQNKVLQYTHNEVVEFGGIQSVADSENWFVGDRFERQSIMFFAISSSAEAQSILDDIIQFNNTLNNLSKIQITILNIEKTNQI